ncbi:hypothetical protein BDZ91DRAFT_731009 [Kalaharituber pfeilii]|nr:hypothetical protein BDZ91DRAFT_731009 [Kalaharituber pfeilii]
MTANNKPWSRCRLVSAGGTLSPTTCNGGHDESRFLRYLCAVDKAKLMAAISIKSLISHVLINSRALPSNFNSYLSSASSELCSESSSSNSVGAGFCLNFWG